MQHLQLQQGLKFTTDDLKANRDGHLSDAQAKRYEPPKVDNLAMMVIVGHAVVIGSILGAVAIVTAKPAMWIVLGMVMAFGILPFVLMNNEGNLNPTLRADTKSGKVKKVCGIVIFDPIKTANKNRVELYIDGITFKLSRAQSTVFVNEEVYCIYYFPRSRTLLTAEPYTKPGTDKTMSS